jgi:hypothetical protein
MQPTQPVLNGCQYPGCTHPATITCRKCHQGFCQQHVHRSWGSSICEFCFLLEQAQGRQSRQARYILCLVSVLLLLSGIFFLMFGMNNVLAVALIVGGITTFGGAASSVRVSYSLRRSIESDNDRVIQQHFNNPDDFIH